MKQIIQSFKTGATTLEEVPTPQVKKGQMLIQTTHSLVSLGTERMLVEFSKANLINKAKQQPEKVKQVLDKIKTEGVLPTLEAVFNKLGQPLPLGYCNVGKVVAVGKGVSEFKIGDRVASNGPHAEYVSVPQNLAAHVPETVSDEEAVFTVVGAIGLQGIRLAGPTFGECFVIVGLGLIGLLTAQLLRSNGCKVIGIDLDEQKLKFARQKGILAINSSSGTNVVKRVFEEVGDNGVDGVIITASAKGDEIIRQSAQMCRKRGRIILVGVIGLNINRSDFYEKEITFQVSCSYGPGRYDRNYEENGLDYPYGFVRWTEKRNFEAVLQAIDSAQLDVKSLITERVPLEDFRKIYDNLHGKSSIASILIYPKNTLPNKTVQYTPSLFHGTRGVLGIIGAGNFTSSTLLPVLKKFNPNLKYIASAKGLTAATLAKKYGIANATSDYNEILNDVEVDLVLITTQHNLHARMTIEALNAGKHVFVEKPLALNKQEFDAILQAQKKSGMTVTVGFNRRFSPLAKKMKELLGEGQMNIVATFNAGFIPNSTWVHDMELGGGRIIGEACHFIDLCSYLAGSNITKVCMNAMGINPGESTDNASILLKYANGSTSVINYFANGSKSYAKERVEVFSQERVLVLDNWRKLTGYGFTSFSKMKSDMDKGHKAQFRLLVEAIKNGGDNLISLDSIANTTLASFAAVRSLKTGSWVSVT